MLLKVLSLCVDYRTADNTENFSPLHAIADARSAIQWVRHHHQILGINPDKIIMCGASSGGFTVLNSILAKDIFDNEENSINYIPNALIMFNPGVDGVEVINRLFPEMNDTAKKISPLHNVKTNLPPMIWFIGTDDIIYESNEEFYKKWLEVGNQCAFHTYEGMPHGFFNYGEFDNKPFEETNKEIEKFLITSQFL